MVIYCVNKYDASTGADAIALMTEWKQFRIHQWSKIKEIMRGNIVVDGRNIFDEVELEENGFEYYRIGKKID